MSEFEFQPGDTIVQLSGPFLKTLNASQKGEVCDNCFQPGKLQRCGGCWMNHYCGVSCQKLDWKEGHSMECKSETFKQAGGTESVMMFGQTDLVLRILRTLAKFHRDPASFSEKHLVYGNIQRSFNDMLSHEERFFKDTRVAQRIRNLYIMLKHHDSSYGSVDFDESFLRRVLGVWKTNAFGIMSVGIGTERHQEVGAGIFIAHSELDHSCRPNAAWHQGQLGKEIRCIYPIKKGEKPTISYICEKLTLEQRQSMLKRHYNFTCVCELCTAEKSAKLIDYSELKPVSKNWTSYQEIFAHREKYLQLLRKVYHEYDSRITQFCSTVFTTLLKFDKRVGNEVPKSVIRKEAMDLNKRMMITFGKQANYYARFQRRLDALEIDLTN